MNKKTAVFGGITYYSLMGVYGRCGRIYIVITLGYEGSRFP